MKTRVLLTFLLTAFICSLTRAQAPTRAQLQPVNARYQWESGGFKNVLYLPLDTPSNAEVGAIAYKNGVQYTKGVGSWFPTSAGGVITADNMANKDLNLTGDRTHNGKGFYFKLDTLAYLQYMVYRNDPFLGNKFYSKMYLDSTINGFPFRFISALRNAANTTDSIHTQFAANENGTFIYNYGQNGNRYGYFQFLGNDDSARLDIGVQSAFKYSNYSFGRTLNLLPADSMRIKLPAAAAAPKMIGLQSVSPAGNVYTPVAVDMGNFITGLHGAVNATGPGDAATTLSNTGVVPGNYTNMNATVGIDGRIITASSGAGVADDLQAVTSRGKKTKDTIIVKGIRTPDIFGDTLTEPDYEIDLIPDIQHMTQDYPALLDQMFQWFHDSATYYNTKAIIQLGDITNQGTVSQFITASNVVKHIDSTGIPYAFVIGNHDYDSMAFVSANVVNRVTNNYNAYFGPARYAAKPFYGGNYNGSNENFYIKFDAGSTKYMAISLEFLPRDSALAWAQRVLDSFPDRKTIIATHNYLSFYGEKSTDTSTYTTNEYGVTGNAGQAMWDKLIKKNPQIVLVACGHQIHRVLYIPVVQRITEAGQYGNVVNQILTNYQDDTNGGNGYFMRITVSPATGKATMKMFSPTLHQVDTRFPPFTLGYPETKVSAVVGISGKYGGLNVAGETRLDSNVFVTQIPHGKIVYTNTTGKLDSLPAQNPHKFLAGGINATDTNAYFRRIDTSDLPSGSGRYIQNLTPVGNSTTGMQLGSFHIKGTGVIGGPTGSFNNNVGGAPITFAVSHQSGNYGLSVQRAAGNNTSGANLSFVHTYGSDWATQQPVQVGAELGVMSWFGTDSTNTSGFSTTRRGMSLRGFVEKVTAGYISSNFDFRCVNMSGAERNVAFFGTADNAGIRFFDALNGSGNIVVGSDNNGKLRKVIAPFNATGDTLQIGQPIGATGDPAKLDQSREIPFNGFDLRFKNIGQNNTGNVKYYKDPSKGISFPFVEFRDQRDTILGQIYFDSLDNTGIGKRAGQSFTTATFNTLLGSQAGVNITSGTANTLIGVGAGKVITTGFRNVGVGVNSLFRLTTGAENMVFGGSSGTNITSGNDNLIFGYTVANNITTGNYNIAMGGGGAVTSAFSKNQTGNRNIVFGISAAAEAAVSTSQFNGTVAIGTYALARGTTGDKNIALGDSAGLNVNQGKLNVIIGANSLMAGQTMGDSNIIVSPGMTSSTISNNNIFVGSNFHSTSSLSNVSIFGAGMTNNQNNIARIARNDQNLQVGYTGDQTDNGYRVQINGAAYVKDSLKVDNMPTGSTSDSQVVVRNSVFYKIANTSASVLKGTTTWAPGVVSAGSSTITTISVTGASLGDPVTISKASGAYSNGEIYDAFVSATNTVTIRVHNVSTGSANYSTTETYNIVLLKY